MKRLFTLLLWVVALGCAIYGLNRFDQKITDGFSHAGIIGTFPPYEEGHLTAITAQQRVQLDALFSQPFYYFAKGAQCFALESSDGMYVLKCFKQKHLHKTSTLKLLEYVPFLEGYVAGRLERRRKRWECMTIGAHVAYKYLREATGLLYLHLAPTTDLPKVTIIDYRGIAKEMDPNQFPFYLQKKGVPLRQGFLAYRAQGDIEGAKQALHAIFAYLVHRSTCDVLDADPGYIHNLGWIDGKGTNLDIGKLVYCNWIKEPGRLYDDLSAHLASLRQFFQQEYPELSCAYDDELAALKPEDCAHDDNRQLETLRKIKELKAL